MPVIDSRAIRRIEWRDGTLSVRLADGDRYDHAEAPQRVHGAVPAAGLARAFFRQHVRGACPCLKVRG